MRRAWYTAADKHRLDKKPADNHVSIAQEILMNYQVMKEISDSIDSPIG